MSSSAPSAPKTGLLSSCPAIQPFLKPDFILKTHKQVDSITLSLCRAAKDTHSTVSHKIASSLQRIGIHHPALVLTSAIHTVATLEKSSPVSQRVLLLQTIQQLVDLNVKTLDIGLLKNVSVFLLEQMIWNPNVDSAIQDPCLLGLTTISQRDIQFIIHLILEKMLPGVVPHQYLILCLTKISKQSPLDFFAIEFKQILRRLIQVTSSLKSDSLKIVFAEAIYQFCSSLQTFRSNPERASTLDPKLYSSDILNLFEIFMTQWIHSSNIKLRIAVVESLGYLMDSISLDALQDNLVQVLNIYISMLSAPSLPLPLLYISTGFCQVLFVANKKAPDLFSDKITPILTILQSYLAKYSLIVQSLHKLAASDRVIRSELFGCIEHCTNGHAEQTLGFLLTQFQAQGPDSTVKQVTALQILNHILQDCEILNSHKETVLAGISSLAINHNLSYDVQYALTVTIIEIIPKGYLSLEGGYSVFCSLARMAAIPDTTISKYAKKHGTSLTDTGTSTGTGNSVSSKKQSKKLTVEPMDPLRVRLEAQRGLYSSVLHNANLLRPILWPRIFTLMVTPQYNSSIGVLAQSTLHLIKDLDNAPFDRTKYPDLPSDQAIFCRIFQLLVSPQENHWFGTHLLLLLSKISILPPAAQEVVQMGLPKVKASLTQIQSQDSYQFDKWTRLLLQFFKAILQKCTADSEWISVLCETLVAHFSYYVSPSTDSVDMNRRYSHNDPHRANMILQFLGTALSVTQRVTMVRLYIDSACSLVSYSDPLHRAGLAQLFGIVSINHFDATLEKVSQHKSASRVNSGLTGGSSGFFSKIFSSSPQLPTHGPLSIHGQTCFLLSYGYIALNAPIKRLASHISAHLAGGILSIIENQVGSSNSQSSTSNNKLTKSNKAAKLISKLDIHFQEAVAKSIDLIAKAMHRIDSTKKITLDRRDDLIYHLFNLFLYSQKKSKHDTNGLLIKCLYSLSSIISVNSASVPQDPKSQESLLLDSFINFMTNFKFSDSKTISADQYEKQACIHLSTFFKTLLKKNPERIEYFFKKIAPLTLFEPKHIRYRAVSVLATCFQNFYSFAYAGLKIPELNYHSIFATLLPRVTDSVTSIRKSAIQAYESCLEIDALSRCQQKDLSQDLIDSAMEKAMAPWHIIKDQLAKQNGNALLKSVSILAKFNVMRLGTGLSPLLQTIQAVLDHMASETLHGSTCAVYVNSLINERGTQLKASLGFIVDSILKSLSSIEKVYMKKNNLKSPPSREELIQDTAYKGTLLLTTSLAKHHLVDVLNQLVQQVVPLSHHVLTIFAHISQNSAINLLALKHLSTILDNNASYILDPQKHTEALAEVCPVASYAHASRFRRAYFSKSLGMMDDTPTEAEKADASSSLALWPILAQPIVKKNQTQYKPFSYRYRNCTVDTRAATVALSEMFTCPVLFPVLSKHFSFFCSVFLKRCVSVHGMNLELLEALTGFQKLLEAASISKRHQILDNQTISLFGSSDMIVALQSIVHQLFQSISPSQIKSIVTLTLPALKRTNVHHQLVALVVFGEALLHSSILQQEALVNEILQSFTSRVNDTNPAIRIVTLRSISTAAGLFAKESISSTFFGPLIAALVPTLTTNPNTESIDSNSSSSFFSSSSSSSQSQDEMLKFIYLIESLITTSYLLENVPPSSVMPFLANLAQTLIQKVSTSTNNQIISESLWAFHYLIRLEKSSSVVEQFHTAFIPVILHIPSFDSAIRACAKNVLKSGSSLLPENVFDVFASKNFQPSRRVDFPVFLDKLTKAIASDLGHLCGQFTSQTLGALTSHPNPRIKFAAIHFLGALLGTISLVKPTLLPSCNPSGILQNFENILVNNKDPGLRSTVAQALAKCYGL